jgi:hypothetical protein
MTRSTIASNGAEGWSKQVRRTLGIGSQGKGNRTGAMTVLAEGVLPENMVLSTRDEATH